MENKEPELQTDRKIIQNLLRYGLALSMLLMILGLILNVSNGRIESVSVPMFSLFSDSPALNSQSLGDRLLGLGVFILALTPALRVMALAILWAREKDWKFVGISLMVLVALIISVVIGGHS